jgi:hypothetical protein
MPSFFKKLFKSPSNKTVRTHPAIKETGIQRKQQVVISKLSTALPEERQQLIKTILEPSEKELKQLALAQFKSISDSVALHEEFCTKYPESPSKPLVAARLLEVAKSEKLSLFDVISDQELIAEILLSAKNPELWQSALARISNPKALFLIASKGHTAAIRMAAAQQLEDIELVEKLNKQSKTKDKTVFQITKQKLDALKQIEKVARQEAEERSRCLNSIQEHARTEPNKLYEARMTALAQNWKKWENQASKEELEAFSAALATCKAQYATFEQEIRAIEENEKQVRMQSEERAATLETLEQTLARLQEVPAESQIISSLDALIKTQETRWLEATQGVKVDKQEQKQYEHLMRTTRQLHASLGALNSSQAALTEALEHENKKKLNTLAEEINWPEGFSIPPLLAEVYKKLDHIQQDSKARQQDVKKAKQKLETLLSQLSDELDDKQYKASQDALKKVHSQLEKLPSKESKLFLARIKLLETRFYELRDWQGFAVMPKQETLCEQMEALCDVTMEPRAKADKIRQLQSDWKALGGSLSQDMWHRFKAAADKAYEPCKAFFEERKQLESINLAKRVDICDQLEQFLDQYNWDQPDWKAVEKIDNQARNDWKHASPVDFKEGRPVQQRFTKLLKSVEARINKERKANEELKRQIVEAATQLVQQENIEEAIEQAKRLQKEWQSIGITHHKEDRQLWKAFRKECDALFARRDAIKKQNETDTDNLVKDAEQALQQLEIILNKPEEDQVLSDYSQQAKLALDLCQQYLSKIPRSKIKHLQNQFNQLHDNIQSRLKRLQAQAALSHWESIKETAYLCRELISAQEEKPEEVKSKFASKIDELNHEKRIPTEIIDQWKQVLTDEVKANTSTPQEMDELRQQLVLMEIIAGLESADEDNQLRMELQVKRLQDGLQGQNNQIPESEVINQGIWRWYNAVSLGQIDEETIKQNQSRIDQITAASA